MKKEQLIEIFDSIDNNYVWELYYFTIDRRKANAYNTYKVTFRNDSYLDDYARNLISSVQRFQLSKITEVQDYNGANTKVSCDKVSLNDYIIKDEWDAFYESLVNPFEDKIKSKIQGYLLLGKPLDSAGKSIALFKVGNPVIKLSNNKAHFYLCNENGLDAVTDDYCKLYLSTDFFVYDSELYTFNLKFEEIFSIEKTMTKIKEKRIEEIVDTNYISNVDQFRIFAQQYKSAKTFITFSNDRVEMLSDETKRKNVADRYGFTLDDNNAFILDSADKASLFIRLLCYKVFEEAETHDVIEASNVTKLVI